MANNQPGLKKVGEYWHYSLKVNGQRVHGSTRAKDLATAKKILEEKRKEILCGQFRIVTKIPTLAELVKEWLKVHQSIHSAKHIDQVEQHARTWLIPALGTTRIDQINTPSILGLRNRILAAGRSPVTANNMLRIVRLLYGYALKANYLERVPFAVKPIRVQKKPRPTVSAHQVQAFLSAVDKAAQNPHVAVILRVLVGLGLRESEALGMRWEWFDPSQRTYVVGKAKGKEARVLPVPDWLWNSIHAMPKTLSEWVFPAEDGKPHRAQFCKKALQRVCKVLGLSNLTQHRLRSSFASLHAETGTPITEIQAMLGHKNIATTMIYVETSLDARRRSQDNLSRRLGLA